MNISYLCTQATSCQKFLPSFQSQFDTSSERNRHEDQLADDDLLANLLPMAELKLGREVTIEELNQVWIRKKYHSAINTEKQIDVG